MMRTLAGGEEDGGRTVVVGVKLDSQSRELLTWAMVKMAQPGDRVVALHVLSQNQIVDRDGKSSLLSLVKAFDSVLAVYEGFCNLKQVDLKLKICRGSSARKILVREAKSFSANKVIVGTSRTYHTIRSSASVAKYCASKLSKDCWVLAVNNGKIVYQRESSPSTKTIAQAMEDQKRNSLLNSIQRSLNKNSKVLNEALDDLGTHKNLEQELAKLKWDSKNTVSKQECSICSPEFVPVENPEEKSSPGEVKEENPLAVVAVENIEVASSSVSLLIRELPELRPGWPLLRRTILPNQRASNGASVRSVSVVQWAMKLPTRQFSFHIVNSDTKQSVSEGSKDEKVNLDGESGAIVPLVMESMSPLSTNQNSTSLPEELEGLHEKYSSTCRLFKYEELVSATSNFKPGNMIGKGGSSQVYKGCLPDGKELAVKILKPSEDVLKEFVLEIEIVTTLHHENIISLFGFCFEDSHLLLVYDFLSRGSLEDNLYGNEKDRVLFGWKERHKVALGVAEALDYLHCGISRPVIHRDVKSSNILLSDDFEPQLSDFGLAKWASTSSSHITCTDVAGTFGYLAPEYFMYGKVNEKIDVYAFGVVLLELLSGRKPISNDYPKGQESLVMWAKPILNGGKFAHFLDPKLENNYDNYQMERMVLAATLCIRRSPRARPQMSIILKLLQGDEEIIKWARLQVNASEEFDTMDDDAFPRPNLQSHLNVALLGMDEEDSLSVSSVEQNVLIEDYLQGRWSRSSSFD